MPESFKSTHCFGPKFKYGLQGRGSIYFTVFILKPIAVGFEIFLNFFFKLTKSMLEGVHIPMRPISIFIGLYEKVMSTLVELVDHRDMT